MKLRKYCFKSWSQGKTNHSYLLKCFRDFSVSFPVCSLFSSTQQHHYHRELCLSSCLHQNFKSACADQEHPSADRSSTMGSSNQMNSSKVRLRKQFLQQDSGPSYRVKFRNPLEKKRIHSGKLFPHVHNLFLMRQRVSHPCTKGWQRLKHQFVPTGTLLQDCTKDLTLLFWLSAGEVLTCSDIKMWKGNVRQMESFSPSSEKKALI